VVSINRELPKIMTTMKIPKLLLAIGTLSALFFSPCNGQQTNTPTPPARNQRPPADGFQPWRFRTPGFTLSNTVFSTAKVLPPVQKGSFTLPDGTTYTGEYVNGLPQGDGTVTNPNGSNLHGKWVLGQPYRVKGTWVEPDGTREMGAWNGDGNPSGGIIEWKDGRRYDGPWKPMEDGPELPDGTGTMTWSDGRKYVGQFHDGKMQGTGKMTHPDGSVEEGFWVADKFIGTGSGKAGSAGTK